VLASVVPCLLDVIVERETNVCPMIPTGATYSDSIISGRDFNATSKETRGSNVWLEQEESFPDTSLLQIHAVLLVVPEARTFPCQQRFTDVWKVVVR